ncbi:hypothetical protein ACLMJK_009379 [Lecanora helva]
MKARNINLAWAVPVDHAQLGARLETYVETKAAITTFRACLSHSSIPSMRNLPPEVMEMIAAALKDIAYVPKIRGWNRASKCVANNCKLEDHYSESDVRGAYFACDYSKHADEMLFEYYLERHPVAMKNHLRKINFDWVAKDNKVSKFTQCRKVFANDFGGIEPYFTILECSRYYRGDFAADLESAIVHAYLILPISQIPISAERGDDESSYAIDHTLNPKNLLQPLSDNEVHRFKLALNALRLEAPHIHVIEDISPRTKKLHFGLWDGVWDHPSDDS